MDYDLLNGWYQLLVDHWPYFAGAGLLIGVNFYRKTLERNKKAKEEISDQGDRTRESGGIYLERIVASLGGKADNPGQVIEAIYHSRTNS